MLKTSLKSVVALGSATFFVAALGTHAFGANECRDLRTDIAALRVALGVIDGKVDQSNQSSAALRAALAVVGGKVDQSNQSSAAIRVALGVLDGKVGRSNADLALVRAELQRIREALLAQSQANGGLQLQVWADETSCASGAIQCASAVMPSNVNQIPVELRLLVLRDQVSVTDLQVDDFGMASAFSPDGGPNITACAARETGCGAPEFFINRGNGGYQMWVHPPTGKWVSGTYSLLLRVTDTQGQIATKLVNVAIGAGTGNPGTPPITDRPGSGLEQNPDTLTAVD